MSVTFAVTPDVAPPKQRPDNPTRHPKRRSRFRMAIVVLLLVYMSSYLMLSRRAFARADAMGLGGLWFFTPEDGEHWRLGHYKCVVVYSPLIVMDNLMGTGREVTHEPTWDLE